MGEGRTPGGGGALRSTGVGAAVAAGAPRFMTRFRLRKLMAENVVVSMIGVLVGLRNVGGGGFRAGLSNAPG